MTGNIGNETGYDSARRCAAIGAERWTPAEIDQLRRKLLADHGSEGKPVRIILLTFGIRRMESGSHPAGRG